MNLRPYFGFFLAFLFLSPARANESQARREFFNHLGFNDISAIIAGKLERKEYHNELNRRAMVDNIAAYQVVNAARDLGIFMLNVIDGESPPKKNELALFAAKMLALKPLAPATDYPSEILNLKDDHTREVALANWLRDQRIRQMDQHKKRLLSDISFLLYGSKAATHGAELQQMDQWLSTIVRSFYLDDTIGKGKYFGRALTALLLREEILHKEKFAGTRSMIKRELKDRYDLRLENFFGDTLVIDTPRGEQHFKIENGTMMLTRNLSPGSLQISWAAVPKNLYDRWRARFKGLIGTPLANPLFVNPEDTENGIGLRMRIRDRIAQGGILRMGFSHIVYLGVLQDPISRLQMQQAIDNYPNSMADRTGIYRRTGGARLTFPEQVIDMGHHSAVYLANPIAEKVQEWSKKSVREKGYQEKFFPSVELELDGDIPVKNSRADYWTTEISKADFEKLHSEPNAKKLSSEIWRRVMDGLRQSAYESWIFHWPDPYDFYLVGATYCSQLLDMVMRKVVGISAEEHESTWHLGLRFFANVGQVGKSLTQIPGLKKVGESLLNLPNVRKAMKITQIKIISPTSLVLQPYMKGTSFRLESKSPEQRAQSAYATDDYRELNPSLTHDIESKIDLHSFASEKVDTIASYGAAIRDFEYGVVMRASRGIKTLGFSPETMAEIAIEECQEQLRTEEQNPN